jgi:hypothetical protein
LTLTPGRNHEIVLATNNLITTYSSLSSMMARTGDVSTGAATDSPLYQWGCSTDPGTTNARQTIWEIRAKQRTPQIHDVAFSVGTNSVTIPQTASTSEQHAS